MSTINVPHIGLSGALIHGVSVGHGLPSFHPPSALVSIPTHLPMSSSASVASTTTTTTPATLLHGPQHVSSMHSSVQHQSPHVLLPHHHHHPTNTVTHDTFSTGFDITNHSVQAHVHYHGPHGTVDTNVHLGADVHVGGHLHW